MAEEYTEEQLQEILNRQKRLVQQLELSDAEQQAIFARQVTTGNAGQQAVQDFDRLELLFEQDVISANALRESKDEEFEARLDLGQYVPAGSPTQAPNNVSPEQSPAAEQAEAPTRTNNRQRAQARRSAAQDPEVQQQAEESFDEFSDIQRDISVEPEVPTQDESVNTQSSNRARAQAQRIQNANAEDVSFITSPAAEQVESNRQRAQEQRINLNSTEDTDETGYPGEDPFAEESFGVVRQPAPVTVENTAANEDINIAPPPDPVPQINTAALERLKSQAAIRATREPSNKGDWRVRLQLAPNAPYFYNSTDPGILAPLRQTDGIIFPYTPRISIAYQAQYNKYLPTHSNYNNYWYSGSSVGEINIDAEFTAQDTQEANYLLAVIHFLKSASKMFYGQDADRGSPPPVLFLTGFGEYQFNEHPVIISQFNYVTPNDVNYIRANATQINGQTNGLQFRKPLSTNSGPSWAGSTVRKLLNGLPDGGEVYTPAAQSLSQNNATYVPTKVEFNMQLLPVNTRRETSQRFSLGEYANGNLLRGGFW